MKQTLLFALLFHLNTFAGVPLKNLPLRSEIQFGRQDFLEFTNGSAGLGKIGCYIVSRDGKSSLSIKNRSLDLIGILENRQSHLVIAPYRAYEYEFLEGYRLSNVKLVCHEEVTLEELQEELRGRARIRIGSPKQRVSDENLENILEYGVGTILKTSQAQTISGYYKGKAEAMLFEHGHFQFNTYVPTFCQINAYSVSEAVVLRKGTTLYLYQPPSSRINKPRSVRVNVLSFVDVVTGQMFDLECSQNITRFKFETRTGHWFRDLL